MSRPDFKPETPPAAGAETRGIAGRLVLLPLMLFIAGYSERHPVVVRSINLAQPEPQYPRRMAGIADEVYDNYPADAWWTRALSPGLVGLQEVRETMTNCQAGNLNPYEVNGARCFAELLAERYGQYFAWYFDKMRYPGWPDPEVGGGIVVDSAWRVLDRHTINVGPGFEFDEFQNFDRYLLETLVEHRETGQRLRFYVTHFYPGQSDQRKQVRAVQAQETTDHIRARAQPGELPPILVGDFNSYRVYGDTAEAAVVELETHFWRPVDVVHLHCGLPAWSGIDIIYIGRRSSFPESAGGFTVGHWRNVPLPEIFLDGQPLSDHEAVGFDLFMTDEHVPDESPSSPSSPDRICSVPAIVQAGDLAALLVASIL